MTKSGFKSYLRRTRSRAECHSLGTCVLANYLRTDLGYRNPVVCGTYFDVSEAQSGSLLPVWAKRVIDVFDVLGDKLGGSCETKVLRAAQYRKPLLAALS